MRELFQQFTLLARETVETVMWRSTALATLLKQGGNEISFVWPAVNRLPCGADFQSAVSRISNPQAAVGAMAGRLEAGDTAGWKPALRLRSDLSLF
jgi:hypothetical protein